MRETGSVVIELVPLGKRLVVPRGTPLQDALFPQGVEFPCGGRGRCKRCRVKVLAGRLAPAEADLQRLSQSELDAGWRLACQARADDDLKLELAQWEAAVLSDESTLSFAPRKGWGAAVDLGTTTIVAQLLDLSTGNVLGVRTGLNCQAQYGSDVMSRIEFALDAGGFARLTSLVREQIGRMIMELASEAESRFAGPNAPSRAEPLREIVIVGNTVMHHLFCGISVEPLSHHPFRPDQMGLKTFRGAELGWVVGGNAVVLFLPCLGGFVGSDILAGILATDLHLSDALAGLVDLGTNGEIVIGTRERLLCASTAAGPAFEGARISMGMLAASGAISAVTVADGALQCHVLGGGSPRGICGSGLVDATAIALDLGLIERSGRLANGDRLLLQAPVALTQKDIRELQLAKGAIAAGIRLLLEKWGASPGDLKCLWLAGAFGNYVNRRSARRIGLIPGVVQHVKPAGNTALRGAKLALLRGEQGRPGFSDLCRRIQHVPLNEDPGFHEAYVSEMLFPAVIPTA